MPLPNTSFDGEPLSEAGFPVKLSTTMRKRLRAFASEEERPIAWVIRRVVGAWLDGVLSDRVRVANIEGSLSCYPKQTILRCPVCDGFDCIDPATYEEPPPITVSDGSSSGCSHLVRMQYQCNCGARPVLVIHNHKGTPEILWGLES